MARTQHMTNIKKIDVKKSYKQHFNRLSHYYCVLKRTKADETILKSKEDLDYIEVELNNTKYLLKMLMALMQYDFGQYSVDQVYRQRLGINGDRLKRLLMNGSRLCETEKEKIKLFIVDLNINERIKNELELFEQNKIRF